MPCKKIFFRQDNYSLQNPIVKKANVIIGGMQANAPMIPFLINPIPIHSSLIKEKNLTLLPDRATI